MKSVTRKVSRIAARRGRKGQALVEMALVASLFLLLLVVALEGGLALAMGHSFTVAAREAARHLTCGRTAEQDKTLATAEGIVRTSLSERFGPGSAITQGAVVTLSPSPTSSAPGTRITVLVSYALPATWFINRSGNLKVAGKGIFELQGTL